MITTRRLRAAVLATLLLASATSTGTAAEHFYVLIFGSQSQPKRLRYTHTWATFVRAVGEGSNADDYALYVHTISWLPQTLDVRVWNPIPEPGVNLDLYQTLGAVGAHDERVTMWGPFVLTPDIYERSLRVHTILQSGVAEYRAISTASNMLISDCIHAVAAVDLIFGRNH